MPSEGIQRRSGHRFCRGGIPLRPPVRLHWSPGGRRCRCRRDRLPARRDAAACPGIRLPRADPRCTSAARGATDARRSCGRRRSSPGCTSAASVASRILICLATRFAFTCSTIRLDDLDQVVVGQRVEQDDLVQAVEELGVERPLDFAAHHVFHLGRTCLRRRRREAQCPRFFEEARADVRRHDDDGVLEVHRGCRARRSTGRLRTPAAGC